MNTQILELVRSLPFSNLDLLSVGITIAAILLLGFVIYISDRRSVTNRSFLAFSIVTILWGFFNYLSYQTTDTDLILWLFRAVIFLGVWHSFIFFYFLYVFPEREKPASKFLKLVLFPWVIFVSLFTLSPYVFSGVAEVAADGSASKTIVAKGIVIFVGTVITLIIAGFTLLVRKILKAKHEDRRQYTLIFVGAITTFTLLFTFNLILPALFLNVRYIPLGALFIFPFIAFTAYAIYKHKTFHVRNIAPAILAFLLCLVTFGEIVFANNQSLLIFRISIFILTLIISIQFVRNLFNLERANEQQESLIHFISHEVKGYLTKSGDTFAGILEGDYGAVGEEVKTLVGGAFKENRKGVKQVEDILRSSNQKKGTIQYDMKPFDFKKTVEKAVEEMGAEARAKGLEMKKDIDPNETFNMVGDENQLSEYLIRNLIKNAINYTLTGHITVSLSKKAGKLLFSVKDTGMGITEETMARLFTEGGRGADSVKINVHSTGYGLYIAKGIVEAHSGKIWAESEGKGKGSTFFTELNLVM